MTCVNLTETDSTNTYARKFINENGSNYLPLLVTAEKQTAGRGRQGHDFYSESGKNIYMTVACPYESFEKCVCPTAAAAVSVRKVLSLYTDDSDSLKIKWVNDIYQSGRKICGILTELFTDVSGKKYIITGVGINISVKEFPADIRDKAGNYSIKREFSGKDIADKLSYEICREYLKTVQSGDFIESYRKYSFVSEKSFGKILYSENGEKKQAEVIGINDDASLSVTDASGKIIKITSGEIELLPGSAK